MRAEVMVDIASMAAIIVSLDKTCSRYGAADWGLKYAFSSSQGSNFHPIVSLDLLHTCSIGSETGF